MAARIVLTFGTGMVDRLGWLPVFVLAFGLGQLGRLLIVVRH